MLFSALLLPTTPTNVPGGEEDQQHCDDVFVPDALSHEGELFFKRDTAVLQTGDEDRCQKRDDNGDVVEAHRNF